MDRRHFLLSSSGLLMSSPLALASLDCEAGDSAKSTQTTTLSFGEQVEAKLLDWRYLEQQMRDRGVFDLIEELQEGISALSLDRPGRRLLVLIREAIRRETMFLAEHPDRLFQCVWNLGWWYDGPLTRMFLSRAKDRSSNVAPWDRAEPKLSTWLEQWRAAREVEHFGATWIRALTPPELPLGIGYLARLSGHRESVTCLVMSPDGRWVASAAHDHSVILWDTQRGEPRHWPEQSEQLIAHLAFTADGQRIAATTLLGEVFVWDVESNRPIARWSADVGLIHSLKWSPDGQSLWTGGVSEVACWQAETGLALRRVSLTRGLDWRCDLSITEEAQRAATAGPDGVWLIDLSSGAASPIAGLEDGKVEEVIFSPDGRLLLTNSLDDCARVWETQTATPLWNTQQVEGLTCPPNTDDWSVAFTPDSQTVIVASVIGTIRLLDARSGLRRPSSLQIIECPTHLTASADGKLLAAVERHRVINLLNLQHREPAPIVRAEFSLSSVWAASPNGRWLVTVTWSGSFILWDLVKGVPLESWLPADDWSWSKANLPEDSFHDTDSIERFISKLAITNAGDLIAIADRQPQIKLLDRHDGGRVRILHGQTAELERLGFSADGRFLASHNTDGTVLAWQTDTAESCDNPDSIRNLFANQDRPAINKQDDKEALARLKSEHFESAEATFLPQGLAHYFERLPGAAAATWLCEFVEPPLLLRLETERR